MTEPNVHLEIDRRDPGRTRLRTGFLAELAPGEVRFRIERFAITANNVTYATVGHTLGYWDFFPSGDERWGRVPAMGWGEVVASAHPDVAVGGRYYGWYPMSRSVDVRVSVKPDGLRDEGAHRKGHAPVYRSFTATDRDPFHQPGDDAEDRIALLRGLFLTAFLADDFFAEKGNFGASRAIVLSASSKTAIGFAQCAARRGLGEIVGLTSAANRDFVRGLDWYDRVITYDEVEAIPTESDAIAIDMAGNGAVLARVHAHLGARLKHSMAVGISHHGAAPRPPDLPGPRPEFFFAPSRVSQRVADWGAEAFQQRAVGALREFVDGSRRWLEVERVEGPEAAQASWNAVFENRVPPRVGCIACL